MDFVNRLKKDHLRSFWYFPSKINFALIGTFGSLLLATAPCQEEADFYRTRLAEYRWTLTVSSRTADFLSFAVDSLDSSSTLLQNMPKKPLTKDVSAQFSAARAIQNLSPPQDELMTDAPPSMHLGHLPGMESANLSSATASGLASPSTSVSSDSPTYEAYVGSFTGNRAMDLT
ncbi:Fungal specific transcription factor [Loxospora ochrophaea]|nr:Fungal specific transcription factor [Loxospora ochrophaea]